jgi:hypothetical protein
MGTFKQLVDRLGEELYMGVDANHAGIASGTIANDVIDLIVSIERQHGDLADP